MSMFAQHICGCPLQGFSFPYRCRTHVNPARQVMPGVRTDTWYLANTCPFCGRVNPGGLCCNYDETCPDCRITTCAGIDMMHWLIFGGNKSTSVCAAQIRPFLTKNGKGRTKAAKTYLERIARGELTLIGQL